MWYHTELNENLLCLSDLLLCVVILKPDRICVFVVVGGGVSVCVCAHFVCLFFRSEVTFAENTFKNDNKC